MLAQRGFKIQRESLGLSTLEFSKILGISEQELVDIEEEKIDLDMDSFLLIFSKITQFITEYTLFPNVIENPQSLEEKLLDTIDRSLVGITFTKSNSPHRGWWDTDEQAEFGKGQIESLKLQIRYVLKTFDKKDDISD